MPYAVTSNTGHEYFVAAGVGILPNNPTIVDELTPEMEYHKVNLLVSEIDQEGKPLESPAPVAPPSSDAKERDAVMKERDQLKVEIERLNQEVKSDSDSRDALVSSHQAQVGILESLLPTGKTALGLLKIEQLKALAEYRSVKVEGEDKATYVAALAPSE